MLCSSICMVKANHPGVPRLGAHTSPFHDLHYRHITCQSPSSLLPSQTVVALRCLCPGGPGANDGIKSRHCWECACLA